MSGHTQQDFSLDLSSYAGKTISFFEWYNADAQPGTRIGRLHQIRIVNSSPCLPSVPSDQTWPKNGTCPLSSCGELQHYAGDPINTFSGNYSYQTSDISVAAVGQPLKFERTYNSTPVTGTVVYSRPLGYGWTHNYDIRLTFPTDPGGEANTVILKTAPGSRLRFADNGDGTYAAYPGVWGTLTQTLVTTNTHLYTVTAANQETYAFTTTGRLTQHRHPVV
ncbi:MAG: hypothetical protein HYR94_02205 [Chloroflexi bacterium]|nr:hypothetical protein [Chloroflexota bacterium]